MRQGRLILAVVLGCGCARTTWEPVDSGAVGPDGGGPDSGGSDTDSGVGPDGGDSPDSGGGDSGTQPVPVDYCHIQWPCSQELAGGAASDATYVWVYQDGVTAGEGQGTGLTVQIGVGPTTESPLDAADWAWSDAAYNQDKDGLTTGDLANDEYQGTFTAPSAAGTYAFCGRVSADGGTSWLACDLGGDGCGGSGSDDGFSSATAGVLTVD